MQPKDSNASNRQLDSWKEIAAHLKTSVRTAQRWEEQNGLPVTRVLRDKRSAVYAYTSDLDAWLAARTISSQAPPQSLPTRRFPFWIAAVVLCLLAAGVIYSLRLGSDGTLELLQPLRLTSYPGIETQPVLSPDRRTLAFAFFNEGTHGIAIQPVGSATPNRIFESIGFSYSPQWSPDNKQIAFLVNVTPGVTNLTLYSTQSGNLTEVAKVLGHTWFDASMHAFPVLQWTPDSKSILLGDGQNGVASSLVKLDLATRARSTLYTLPIGSRLRSFALHPGRRQLALVIQSANDFRLHTMDLTPQWTPASLPKPVLADSSNAESPAWLPNGDLVFIRNQRELWRSHNGKAQPIPVNGPFADYSLSASSDGRVLWSHTDLDTAITLYDPVQKVYGKTMCDSTTLDRQPRLSPDGSQVLFNSERDGFLNLWVCDPSSNQLRQLTRLKEDGLWDGDWSPDSSMIVHRVNNGKRSDIVILRASDASILATISGPGLRLSPTWSPDSRQVYFIHRSEDQFRLKSYDLATATIQNHAELDRPTSILMRSDGKFWLRSKGALSLLSLSPALSLREVAMKVSNLVSLTPDRLGAYFSRSVTSGLIGGVDFWSIDNSLVERRITPPLPDSMGFAPGPKDWIYVIRNTSTQSDIHSAYLHAK